MIRSLQHNKIKRSLFNEDGFTLVEILIATAVISIIGIIISGSYVAGMRIKGEQDRIVEMQQNIRVAFHIITRDLRMAGYEIAVNWDPSLLKTANKITGNNTEVGFSYALSSTQFNTDEEGNQIFDPGTNTNFSYYLNNRSLIRNRNNGEEEVAVADNIDFISFTYLDKDGVWNEEPPLISSDIRAVGVTLVARTSTADKKPSTGSRIFNDAFIPDKEIFNSPADNFRRRAASTVVNLRNFGI